MKKLLAILLALILALSLCACNKDKPDGNVPDNVLPPSEDVTTSADKQETPAVSSSEVTEASQPDEDVTSDTSVTEEEVPETSKTDKEEEEVIVDTESEDEPEVDITEIVDIHKYKAFEQLYLLNSDRVHAKFMEAISYDGEYISGSEREIYILGDDFVYITDGTHKMFTQDGDVHVEDFENEVKCIYEGVFEEEGDRFGYGILNYKNIYVSEEEDATIEAFAIDTYGGRINSTWTFYNDGTFTVADLIDDSGAYYFYSFEVVESTFLEVEMQRSIAHAAPGTQLELITVEEYEQNY